MTANKQGSFLSKKTLIITAVVLSGIALVWWWRRPAADGLSYREAPVKRGAIEVSILATGTVAPENRLEIKPPISGRVEQVLVDEGMNVKKGQVLAWMSSTERAALIDAARARGSAELKRWEEFYKPTPVLAPIDGMIIERNVEQGQSFTSAEAIFVLSDRLTVKAQVDETDIAQVSLNQKAKITLDAYPNREFPAHVDKIAYDATTVNNVTTYIVDVLPENPPDFLRSGMTANVNFLVASKADVLLVPVDAIRKKNGHSWVVVAPAKSDANPQEHEITTGLNDGRHTEVVSGLTEGELVLIPQIQMGGGGAQGGNPFSPIGHGHGPRR